MKMQSESNGTPMFLPERMDARSPLHELLINRRSPRAFSERPIEPVKLLSLFEAARWSPSSANEQPWHFFAATKSDTRSYATIADALMEQNRRWAIHAPLFLVGIAQSTYLKSGTRYQHAWYDLGQSVAHLTIQATALGLSVHQMGGFDAGKLSAALSIPENYDAVIVMAVGYAEKPETLPDDLRSREEAPRMRKPLGTFVFTEAWGEPSHHIVPSNDVLNQNPSSN
jgi:nitroreductase